MAEEERDGVRLTSLDQPLGDIVGDRLDDFVELLRLADREAAVTRILHEAIDAAIAPHLDEAEHVDKQARVLGRRQRDIEQVAIGRHLRKNRLKVVLQEFEARDLGCM